MSYRSAHLAVLGGWLFILGGCHPSGVGVAPQIESEESIVVGEALGLRAAGLAPGELYTVVSDSIDTYGRRWVSRARFRADALGVVDPSRQAPEQGAYEGIDKFGLQWSAVMPEPPTEDWQAPEPKD